LNATPPLSAAMFRHVPVMSLGPSFMRRMPESSSATASRASCAIGLGMKSAFDE
jgi:hypothetical protein